MWIKRKREVVVLCMWVILCWLCSLECLFWLVGVFALFPLVAEPRGCHRLPLGAGGVCTSERRGEGRGVN